MLRADIYDSLRPLLLPIRGAICCCTIIFHVSPIGTVFEVSVYSVCINDIRSIHTRFELHSIQCLIVAIWWGEGVCGIVFNLSKFNK
jgi:hypothetical protein